MEEQYTLDKVKELEEIILQLKKIQEDLRINKK